MEEALAAWHNHVTQHTDLDAATVIEYIRDVRRFLAWFQDEATSMDPTMVTVRDATTYRDLLLRGGRAPTTINRALVSLTLFFDAADRRDDNPFRIVDRVAIVEHAPHALTRREWNAVRRAAEQRVRRDHGLALALVSLMRYAGPRVAEVAALHLADVPLSARRGVLIIRRGKGVKYREVPLVAEAREALQLYFQHRQQLAEHWTAKALQGGLPTPAWACWPDGQCFLGQRGPLTARGMRDLVAQVGVAAKLDHPLHPHLLRHTFATALLDPQAYGLDRPPASLPAVQALLGHSDLASTVVYTRASPAALARMMGDSPDDV